jgi:Methyltransferase domain
MRTLQPTLLVPTCPLFSRYSKYTWQIYRFPQNIHLSSVPPNCSFEVDDAEDEWIFQQQFDYIHARMVFTCFKDPKEVIRSAFNSLLPGGYLEFQDMIMPPKYYEEPPTDSVFVETMSKVIQASCMMGRPWTNAQYYAQWMRELGFVEVEERKLFLAAGPWPQDKKESKLGAKQLDNMLDAMEGSMPRLLSHLKWEPEEYKVLMALIREEMLKGRVKLYNHYTVVWGRKPIEEGKES